MADTLSLPLDAQVNGTGRGRMGSASLPLRFTLCAQSSGFRRLAVTLFATVRTEIGPAWKKRSRKNGLRFEGALGLRGLPPSP